MNTQPSEDRLEAEAAETLILLRRQAENRIRYQALRATNSRSLYTHPTHSPGPGWRVLAPPYPVDLQYFPFMHQPAWHIQHPQPPPWCYYPQYCVRQPSDRQCAVETPSTLMPNPIAIENQPTTDENCDEGDQEETESTTSNEQIDNRRKRRNLTKRQLKILESAYSIMKYPNIEDRLKLGKSTQLTEDRIQVWFQNRRAKDRRTIEIT